MIKIAHHPLFCHAVPDGHRFPMAKYRLLPEKLLGMGFTADNFFTPNLLSPDEVLSTHTADYWHALDTQTLPAKACRAIGLPMSPELVLRERYVCHATYECALYAKQYGISLSTSGGTHHAFADRGEGFCLLNDICIASHLLLERGQAKRILIVDLDVHQGNGNASIMADNASVFVFSMHGEKNYPYHKPKSDVDIDLPCGTDDKAYLEILGEQLPNIMDSFNPDMMFYQAGVDVLAADKLGRLSLTLDGCLARDRLVLTTARQRGVPVAVVMGGGYAPDIDVIVSAHAGVFGVGLKIFKK